jgi:ElaB/YqjD/DUF883 family membrane-anchored ribosome-binding protein
MSHRARLSVLGLAVSLSVLASSTHASAAPQSISGRLDQPGYTVIALATDGRAGTAFAQDGSFTVQPPAESVTLHLRAPDGRYAGPFVVEEPTGAVARAKAAVKKAKRKVKKAKRKLKRARAKARTASAGKAKAKATKRLKKARKRLKKARKRLRKARRLLREARQYEALRPFRAVLGVRAGAALGAVQMNTPAGFALVRGLGEASIDFQRVAQASNGLPIGAGNFGRVLSGRTDGGSIGDRDLDGVPGSLDIDDDGDLVLDNLDSPAGPQAAQVPPPDFQVASVLATPVYDTANANAGYTDAQIEESLLNWGRFGVSIMPGDAAELDCRGLGYCSAGGTGRIWGAGTNYASSPPFPVPCCDGDGDGFGTLTKEPASPVAGMTLYHGATTGQSGTGDVFIQHVTTGADESQCPPPPETPNPACTSFTTSVPFVFATVPALVSYSDDAGSSGTVSYPILGPEDPGGPGPGTHDDPFPIDDGPDGDGDVELTMTYWRPQRRPTVGETGYSDPPTAWTDIGGLAYSVGIFDHSGGIALAAVSCPQESFSEADPQLEPALPTPTTTAGRLVDLAGDQPASTANTFTFTLNVSHCLAVNGHSFDSGDKLDISTLAADNSNGTTEQGVGFKRP